MAMYIFLLSVPSLFCLVARRRATWLALSPVFVLYLLAVGFRFKVGMDWNNYEAIHRTMGRLPLEAVTTSLEPLSNLLFWASSHETGGSLLTNFAAGLILIAGVFSFARRTADPWLAVVAATPYLVVAMGMSGIRQAMAMGVILLTLAYWERITTPRRMAGIVIASLFHASALTFTIFAVLDMKVRPQAKAALVVLVGLAGGYVVMNVGAYADRIDNYRQTYINGEAVIASPGAMLHLLLIVIPVAAYVLFRTSIDRHLFLPQLVRFGAWATLALLGLFAVSSTGASRMSIYYHFIPMTLYPALSLAFGPARRTLMRTAIVAFHFSVLVLWLLYANNSFAHMPYRNVLVESFWR